MSPDHRRSRIRPAAAALLVAVTLASCGGSTAETALEMTDPVRTGPAAIEVAVECSRDHRVTVEADAGVDGLPRITIWGHPRSGRCTSTVPVTIPEEAHAVEDGATGMVLTLPAPSPASDRSEPPTPSNTSGSSEPSDPSDRPEPSDATEPTGPVEPGEPSNRTDPVQPSDPSQP